MTPVEGHEARVALLGGCGDQGVRQAGAVTGCVLPAVTSTEAGHLLRYGQDNERLEKLLQGLLFFVAFDAGEQFGDRDHREVEVRGEAFQILYGFASSPQVFDEHVGIYEQPFGHGLSLFGRFATLVELLAQRLEIG